MSESWLLEVTNPLTTGQHVRDMQWLLKGHNRFAKVTYRGEIDGFFGPATAKAAKDMKWFLGYPYVACVPTAGSTLRAYLIPKTAEGALLLPAAYQERKAQRAATIHYPLARVGELIGWPYNGTHTLGNWESDRACDISIPKGTEVLACFEGTIGTQFGPLDSTNPALAGLRFHLLKEGTGVDDDEAYYAHLSKFAAGIKPGVKVQPGDLIGFSGVANGVPHLHFALQNGWPPTFLATSSKV